MLGKIYETVKCHEFDEDCCGSFIGLKIFKKPGRTFLKMKNKFYFASKYVLPQKLKKMFSSMHKGSLKWS